MGQKTIDDMVQSQHDCLVARVCKEAYVEAQQNVQVVSDGRRIGSFQTSLCNSVRMATDVLQDTETESADSKSQKEMEQW